MHITVNGENRRCDDGIHLEELLRELGINPDRAAVLVNDEIVPRADRGSRALCDSDRVEILVFAGGG